MKASEILGTRGREYVATRVGDGTWVAVVGLDGEAPPLRHRMYHSPDGFEWGYGGSGPSDLARSILADVLGYVPVGYHDFKERFIASASPIGFTLTEAEILAWMDEQWGERFPPSIWDAEPEPEDTQAYAALAARRDTMEVM